MAAEETSLRRRASPWFDDSGYDTLTPGGVEKMDVEATPPDQTTPKKIAVRGSIRDGKVTKKHLLCKQPSFSAKIGSCEKNRLLYTHLKPVSPPRKSRTPDKSTSRSPLHRRRLDSLCGAVKVDFLRLLDGNAPPVRRILACLSDEDLMNACRVSRSWRSSVLGDRTVNRRRIRHLLALRREKENAHRYTGAACKVEEVAAVKHAPLADLRNAHNIMPSRRDAPDRSPPVSPRRQNHYKFAKAGSRGSSARSCINCENPAVVEDRWARCQSSGCGIVFCCRCNNRRDYCESEGCKTFEQTSPNRTTTTTHVKNKRYKDSARARLRRQLF